MARKANPPSTQLTLFDEIAPDVATPEPEAAQTAPETACAKPAPPEPKQADGASRRHHKAPPMTPMSDALKGAITDADPTNPQRLGTVVDLLATAALRCADKELAGGERAPKVVAA